MATPKDGPTADLLALESEADHAARNALALVLAERRTPGLTEVLIRQIGREDLRNHRGTLVYALRDFDCTTHLDILAKLVVEGNWEVAHEAFQIIDAMRGADNEMIRCSVDLTTRVLAAEGLEPWRRTLLEDIAAMRG